MTPNDSHPSHGNPLQDKLLRPRGILHVPSTRPSLWARLAGLPIPSIRSLPPGPDVVVVTGLGQRLEGLDTCWLDHVRLDGTVRVGVLAADRVRAELLIVPPTQSDGGGRATRKPAVPPGPHRLTSNWKWRLTGQEKCHHNRGGLMLSITCPGFGAGSRASSGVAARGPAAGSFKPDRSRIVPGLFHGLGGRGAAGHAGLDRDRRQGAAATAARAGAG